MSGLINIRNSGLQEQQKFSTIYKNIKWRGSKCTIYIIIIYVLCVMSMHVSIYMHVKHIFPWVCLLCVMYVHVCCGSKPWRVQESILFPPLTFSTLSLCSLIFNSIYLLRELLHISQYGYKVRGQLVVVGTLPSLCRSQGWNLGHLASQKNTLTF